MIRVVRAGDGSLIEALRTFAMDGAAQLDIMAFRD
jgi:hypothetical protein